jgi:uncharacterized protein (TIGR03000 family)
VLVLLGLASLLWGQDAKKPAILIVRLAPDAVLEIEGVRTKQTGAVRNFQSPPLATDRQYSYTLRPTWKESGQELLAEREVSFQAGQTVEVDLRTPGKADRAPVVQSPAGSFTVVEPERFELEQGATKSIPVRIRRRDFDEAVKLTFAGSPYSLSFVEATIPAGKDSTAVEVTADKAASLGDWNVKFSATAGRLTEYGRVQVTVKEPPRLRLTAPVTLRLEPGEKKAFAVRVWRERFEGPVTVRLEGLAPGVRSAAVTVPAGGQEARLEATAGDDAERTEKEVRVVGKADRVGGESVVRFIVPHKPPLVEAYLLKGKLADGQADLLERLKESPKDDQARFGLGTLQFLRAVEHLGQSLHRYGLRSDRGQQMNIPFLRLPVPANPKPEALTYPAARKVLEELIADLQKSEATLADVQDEDVKLPLRLGLVRLDLRGDGKAEDPLRTILTRYMGGRGNLPKDEDLLVVFDRGDVAWLRGYCHLLMALAEVVLAHDCQELFDCSGHIFFAKAETPHKFLNTLPEKPGGFFDLGGVDLVDIIAFLHLVRLPVKEPERMKTALTHLEKMLALSKESWKYILAETDDDHEWIPNPKQKGALGIKVDQKMVDSWLAFIDEAEAILSGKVLMPLWRGKEERGINLRRVFTEPRTFDLVLWIQGTAATPYLEKGTLTKPEVWERLERVFGGQFIGFAIWFN